MYGGVLLGWMEVFECWSGRLVGDGREGGLWVVWSVFRDGVVWEDVFLCVGFWVGRLGVCEFFV